MHEPGQRDVVEAGHGDLARHIHAGVGAGAQAADRHGVVGGEDRVRPRCPLEQARGGAGARCLVEIAGHHHRSGRGVEFPQRILVPAPALARIAVVGGAGHEGDPAAARVQQVPRHPARPGMAVDRHRGPAAFRIGGVDEDRGQRRGQLAGQRQDAAVGRSHHQHAIDAAAHRLQSGALLAGIAVVGGQQQVQAVRPRLLADAADQFGEELAVQVRQDHADGAGAPAAERACGLVRGVVQATGDLQHAVAHPRRDALLAIDRARDGGHRDPGFARHVLDGDRHAGPESLDRPECKRLQPERQSPAAGQDQGSTLRNGRTSTLAYTPAPT